MAADEERNAENAAHEQRQEEVPQQPARCGVDGDLRAVAARFREAQPYGRRHAEQYERCGHPDQRLDARMSVELQHRGDVPSAVVQPVHAPRCRQRQQARHDGCVGIQIEEARRAVHQRTDFGECRADFVGFAVLHLGDRFGFQG